jgi:hypothetical protein
MLLAWPEVGEVKAYNEKSSVRAIRRMEDQAHIGQSSRIHGIRRSTRSPLLRRGGPRSSNPRRRPGGRGTRPGCLAAADRVLSHTMSATIPWVLFLLRETGTTLGIPGRLSILKASGPVLPY